MPLIPLARCLPGPRPGYLRSPVGAEVRPRRHAPSASPPLQQTARRLPWSAHTEPAVPVRAQRFYTPPKARKSSTAREEESGGRSIKLRNARFTAAVGGSYKNNKERAFARRPSVCGDEGFIDYFGNKAGERTGPFIVRPGGRTECWNVY